MVKSFSQKEPLTIRIKGLLEEYPVGTGILKEALQNSDDAGARVQKFLLDHRTYPTTDLLDPMLARYQGPALLLFNDAVFQDSDFESLSSLGKSKKQTDALKTGKFGLGFNSCYNLTDAPMILSGNQFVVLEPHEEITNRDLRGGFKLDIINDSISENQLKPFEGFLGHRFTPGFDGTIIRLPLRTPSDAARSEISSNVITTDNIIDLFESFKREAIESLLFLKNIEKIEVYELLDQFPSVTSATLLYRLEIGDSHKTSGVKSIRAERAKLIDALQRCTLKPQKTRTSCTMTMVVSLTPSAMAKPCKSSWLIHHTVDGMAESNMDRTFLRDEKLLAWVGLAAPLDFGQQISGRLFTFLPLPITTPFPVHIHGIFGLTRDRRNLISHSPDYPKGTRTDKIATWNQYLFQECIPSAWSRLLVELTKVKLTKVELTNVLRQRHLQYFPPVAVNHPNAMWRDMLPLVLRLVVDNGLPVFARILPSPHPQQPQSLSSPNSQWASLNNAFVDDLNDSIVQTLADSGMLLVHIPQNIRDTLIGNDISFNRATPSAARHHFKQNTQWQKILEAKSKCEILDYLCEDNDLGDLTDLQLIPLANGQFSEFKPFNKTDSENLVYARMMDHEFKLFKEWSSRIIRSTHLLQVFADPDKFSILEKTTNVRRWSVRSAIDCIKQTYFEDFGNSEDEIESPDISLELLHNLWKWIDNQEIDRQNGDHKLDALWLLPMTSGNLRKVRTKHAVFSVKSRIGDTLTLTRLLERAGIAFVHEDFEISKDGYLKNSGLIKGIWDIVPILDWLNDTASLGDINIKEAAIIRAHLAKCLRSMPLQSNLSARHLVTLRNLPIYKCLRPADSQNKKASIVLRNLFTKLTTDELIPVVNLDVVPEIDGIAFVDVSDQDSQYLLSEILKMKICNFDNFIKNVLVPNLESQPEHLLDPLMKIVIPNLLKVSEKQRSQYLVNLKFVQVSSSQGDLDTSTRRRAPSELIDPNVEILTSLLLPDEEAYPIGYYKERGVINQLATLGMSTGLTSSFIKDRINCYVKAWRDAGSTSEETRLQIHSKAVKLLKAIDRSEGINYPNEIVEEAWLPAEIYSNSRKRALMRAFSCRDLQDAQLASYAMPIVQFHVRNWSLRKMFKWDNELSVDTLEKQMLGLLEDARVTNNIQSLLEEMMPVLEKFDKIAVQPKRLANLKTELGRRAWIPLEDRLMEASHVVFSSKFADLRPYVFILPSHLSNHARNFFEFMGVAKFLNYNHLFNIMETIQKEALRDNDGVLNEMQIVMAVRIIERFAHGVGKEDSEITLKDIYDRILVPDTNGRLTELKKLTYNDMPVRTSQEPDNSNGEYLHISPLYSLVNDSISLSVAKKLGIPLLSEQTLAKAMDNEDLFSDHAQKEDICTRIRNNLREYSMESISNEFLANADDSSTATRLCWVFDLHGRYQNSGSKPSLLCQEMEEWQGPALYCYNNGVFTEDDIRGLICVGNGSKQSKNGEKIGKYGLGFMVAYHFTDVPSLVSGDSAVFLDPQQEFLPLNRNRPWERHAGIHLNMRRLGDSQFSDQFAPLKGLFDFDPNKTFEGTLFRFPFRSTLKRADKSKLALRPRLIDEEAVESLLEKLYEMAQRSLFFLRHIEKVEAFLLGSDRKLKPKWSVSLEGLSIETKEARKGLTINRRIFDLNLRMKRHDSDNESREKWIILTDLAPKTEVAQRLVEFTTQERVVPHVGIAARLVANSKDGPFLKAEESRLICFLPMNISIGLPVHIHGCFALQHDRRSIRMEVPDALGNKNLETEWNEFLLQRIAKLYVRALAKLAASSEPKGEVYKYWPNPEDSRTRTLDEPLHNEFWQLLRSPNENRCLFEMYTLPSDTITQKFLSVQDAIFENANDVTRPTVIRSILKHCNYNVVQFPPVLLKKLLENPIPQHFKLITPSLVRKAIRDSSSISSMLKELKKKQLADMLIYLISDKNWNDLDGCRILPLLNDKMATFTLRKPDEEPAYYLPSEEESTLFEFASDQLVSVKLPEKVVDLLKLDSTRLNVGPLTPEAIRRILRQRIPEKYMMAYNPKHIKVPNEAWITKFWKYWDAKMLSITELQDIPLLPIGSPHRALASVNHLDQLSCIQPSGSNIDQIIEKFDDIFILNSKALPSKSIQVQVFNLDSFLDCLAASSSAAQLSVAHHLRSTLTSKDLLVLRLFVIEQLRVTDIKSMEVSRKRVFSQLPIWHVWPNGNEHLATAEEACVLPNPNIFFYLIPSTGGLFFREDATNISFLKHINARTVSLQDYFRQQVVRNLPASFPQNGIVEYCEFLKVLILAFEDQIYKNFRPEVSSARLIPDRTGTLRCASQLFDPAVDLFRNTFGLNRPDLLPHPSAQSQVPQLRRFLRHDVNKTNFVACATEIQRLYLNPSIGINQRIIQNQSTKVFQYLNDEIDEIVFTNEEWRNLKTIQFIPARPSTTPFNSSELRIKYDTKKVYPLLSCMNDLVLPEYIKVAWTQLPGYRHDLVPSRPMRERDPTIGIPDAKLVVEHMVKLAEDISIKCKPFSQFSLLNEKFLESLEATYTFLNKHTDDAADLLQEYKDRHLFFNCDKTSVNILDKSMWHPASSLLLGILYDPSPTIHCVKQRLLPFENLLLVAGAKIIDIVDDNVEPDDDEESAPPNILGKIYVWYLDESEKGLKDVVFVVGREGDVLEQIWAHRVILAASGKYFEKLFMGKMQESAGNAFTTKIRYSDFKAKTFRDVLTYIYTGSLDNNVLDKFNPSTDEERDLDLASEKAHELIEHLLGLLYAADRFLLYHLRNLVQREIVKRKLVRVETVVWLLEKAEKYHADWLAAYCRRFKEANSEVVDMVKIKLLFL